MTILQSIGVIGAGFYILAYGLLQFGVIKGERYTYALLNLIGASMVLLSLLEAFNLSSLIIQVTWISLSIIGFLRIWLARFGLRFSAEERALLSKRFATLNAAQAKTLLRSGVWENASAGVQITKQGAPVERLIYLAQGQARVEIDGAEIAVIEAEEFIGEMSVLHEGLASATVTLTQDARLFAIEASKLRALLVRHAGLAPHVDYAFAASTRAKLVATNGLLFEALHGRARDTMPASG